MQKHSARILGVLPLITLIVISALFYFSSAEQVISLIGVENAYVFIFILAFWGGITTFSGIPYHVVLMALAAGGLNPLALGVTTALAVSLGDCTSYFVGYFGRALVSPRIEHALTRLVTLHNQHPKLLPALFFLYGACVPFSSDLVTIPMGLLRYPLWRVIVPLGIGTVIFNTALAYFASDIYALLSMWS